MVDDKYEQARFIGVEVAGRAYCEHNDSIIARAEARRLREVEPEPYYAIPGCGTPDKRSVVTAPLHMLRIKYPNSKFTHYH